MLTVQYEVIARRLDPLRSDKHFVTENNSSICYNRTLHTFTNYTRQGFKIMPRTVGTVTHARVKLSQVLRIVSSYSSYQPTVTVHLREE